MPDVLKLAEVRDYLYEKIRVKTGNHIILCVDHDDRDIKEDSQAYILSKLENIQSIKYKSIVKQLVKPVSELIFKKLRLNIH